MTWNRTEDGDLEPGDLLSGGYGALEGDLGEKVRPLAGFGRDLEPVEEEEDAFDPFESFEMEAQGTQTAKGAVIYEFSNWKPLA